MIERTVNEYLVFQARQDRYHPTTPLVELEVLLSWSGKGRTRRLGSRDTRRRGGLKFDRRE
jgi:hypothetical protein